MKTKRNKKLIVAVIGLGVLLMMTAWSVVAQDNNGLTPEPWQGWPFAGTWIFTAPQLPDEVFTVQVVPTNQQSGTYSMVLDVVNPTGNYFGLFPDAEEESPYVGSVMRTGTNTYDWTIAAYLTKEAEPFDVITWIHVVSGTVEILDENTFEADSVMSIYSAVEHPGHTFGDIPDQDKDCDGLPDEGEEGVFCIRFTGVGKRLQLMPPGQPSPLPELP
jgi:hypothetical protein